jgi:hypothetical protein
LATLGTGFVVDPDDTSIVTWLPLPAWALAAGFWVTTRPSSTSSFSTGTAFTTNPAWVSSVFASAWVFPTTSGTATISGPVLNVSVIVAPSSTFAPAAGSCSITWLAGCCDVWPAVVTSNPACSRAALAWSTGWPTTVGTVTCSAGGSSSPKFDASRNSRPASTSSSRISAARNHFDRLGCSGG